MTVETTAARATSRLVAPSVLDLTAAPDFLASVRGVLDRSPRLTVDMSAVETITLPCIQVLLAARASGAEIRTERPSAAFVSAFEDLGLSWDEGVSWDESESLDEAPLPAEVSLPEEASLPLEAVLPEEAVLPQETALPEEAPAEPEMNTPMPVDEEVMAKRILTIDDSKTIRDMLKLTLVEAGFDVLQAVDGQDGLNVLNSASAKVDLVITDINMPIMDGYEVIRRIRSDASHKGMPVLVLTTESEVEKRNVARAAGATGWMVKPFDPERLVATINKVAP